MNTLTSLGLQYNTDKAFWHRYTEVYDQWFLPYKTSAKNVLEIGVLNGSSLKMLKTYFENANIVGVDILPKTQYEDERIKCFVCDQSNRSNIQQFIRAYNNFSRDTDSVNQGLMFDVIIDDGSHFPEHQMITLSTLWKSLKPGGIYVVEDLHTSALDFSDASACHSIKRWQDLQKLDSSWLTPEEIDMLQSEAEKVIWWKRDVLPLNCWKCMKTVPCGCNIDFMNDGNGSITSCIVKKN